VWDVFQCISLDIREPTSATKRSPKQNSTLAWRAAISEKTGHWRDSIDVMPNIFKSFSGKLLSKRTSCCVESARLLLLNLKRTSTEGRFVRVIWNKKFYPGGGGGGQVCGWEFGRRYLHNWVWDLLIKLKKGWRHHATRRWGGNKEHVAATGTTRASSSTTAHQDQVCAPVI